MDLAEIAGSPMPIEISGQTLSATPFKQKDFGELTNWVRHHIIKVAKDSLDGMVSSERDEILQSAIRAAASSTWNTRNGRDILTSVEGLVYVGWMLVREKQRLTLEKFRELVVKEDDSEITAKNVLEIDRVFWVLNFGHREESEGAKEEDNPK